MPSTRPPGAHRAPEPDRDRRAVIAAWWDRLLRMRVRTLAITTAAFALVVVGLIVLIASTVGGDDTPTAAPGTTPPTVSTSGPPVPNEEGRPKPGPAPQPGSPDVASAQAQAAPGVNAQALLDEMRTHDPSITDADAAELVEIGNINVHRGQADLAADDPAIRQAVDRAFPDRSPQTRALMARCTAEYVERVIAMNRDTSPPDKDDHGGS